MTTVTPRAATLEVPGATLHHEIRGTGPLLLMLPGGGGDAAVFDGMADLLAAEYTVVTVDPRGYSRSTLDGPREEHRVQTQSDDAYRLLQALSPDAPARVFASSAGAVVALDLLARHPERLHRVVAHEPPSFALLPDAAEQRAFTEEVRELLRTKGHGPAVTRYLQGLGGTLGPLPDPAELPPRTADMMARLMANNPLFMEYELVPFTSYVPDLAALREAAPRLVLAAGLGSRGRLPYRPAALMAERLGLELREFPGGHSGYTDEPEAFGELLLRTLRTD
ncbi:alpha/beta fold hydrolase [Streptomyces sp. NPDC059002]|uniref:alpha/beta fold hydrolase n=1 Tax=Streptomyces sp. NPDC059002 TaxID=3346690 RepID=UPI0036C50685